MGADSRPENNPNASKNLIPKMSAQAQKFKIFEKSSLWVSVVRASTHLEKCRQEKNYFTYLRLM